MKKVLAIMGSPRKKQNTDQLLDCVLNGLSENKVDIEKIYLKDIKISFCTACNYCGETGKCCINDDMQKLYDAFNKSDGIIVASPLYFNTVSSFIKVMIDRCQMFWSSKYIFKNSSIEREKKRIGMFLGVAGSPQGQFDACIPVIDLFFKSINTKYIHNLFISNTDQVPVWERKDKLAEGYHIGIHFFE